MLPKNHFLTPKLFENYFVSGVPDLLPRHAHFSVMGAFFLGHSLAA
jgi:hypothetical protein